MINKSMHFGNEDYSYEQEQEDKKHASVSLTGKQRKQKLRDVNQEAPPLSSLHPPASDSTVGLGKRKKSKLGSNSVLTIKQTNFPYEHPGE